MARQVVLVVSIAVAVCVLFQLSGALMTSVTLLNDNGFANCILPSHDDSGVQQQAHQRRNVTLLSVNINRDDPDDGFQIVDAYSGMWWTALQIFHAHADTMMEMDRTSTTTPRLNLESFSTALFNKHKLAVRLTRDWLDFSVEHLSVYHRIFKRDDYDDTYETLIKILMDNIQKVKVKQRRQQNMQSMAPFATIATIPFIVGANMRNMGDNNERDSQIKIHTLAATLASLQKFGIGRAVVVGRNTHDGAAAQQAFALLNNNNTHTMTMQLRYISGNLNTTGIQDEGKIPKQALFGLTLALTGKFDDAFQQAWLGPDPSRWKYVYYTEPDLILSSRPASVPDLTKALEQDNVVIAAHRLSPFPHVHDLPGLTSQRALPATGRFAYVTPVNCEHWVCCDGGNRYPGLDIKRRGSNCPSFFEECGFHKKGRAVYKTMEEVY